MPVNRDKNGRFIKGNSGGGRPRMPQAFRELAKEKSTAALQAVIGIVENPASDPKDVISGARLVIEYAYGKPAQEVSGGLFAAGDFVLRLTGGDANAGDGAGQADD